MIFFVLLGGEFTKFVGNYHNFFARVKLIGRDDHNPKLSPVLIVDYIHQDLHFISSLFFSFFLLEFAYLTLPLTFVFVVFDYGFVL